MNKSKNLILLLFLFVFNFFFAQNDNEYREAFTLKLPVDSVQFFQQEVAKSKYLVKENTLQIYPGEHLFIETEVENNVIKLMNVVKENKNPSKTIEIKFSQEVSNRESKGMTLLVINPFNKKLNYDALMYIVGRNEWIKTSIIPIRPKLQAYELWKDTIISLVLHNWRFED
ncbi:hypothetical protein [Chryseobacterium polytrichastri]|uniref:Uncharacterized protein n=1 Tax=Chryseobacterium polytrichastri TaxID=1302687 RepID=A0A1M6SJQ2_9FLAO|nr:hypothetical protein [Chryseobacterium polytrichastri]SHK44808.1 hypothetical protein SAMN05444267_100443 [Chryseobacterium polytrichastri]